jgi:3-hydroxyacyl-CoA dehydrogenase
MSEERNVNSVAVLGGGTMGTGIAGACAQAGCEVLLLDVSAEAAEQAMDRIVNGRPPAVDDAEAAARITLGTLDGDLDKIAGYDWICEAVIEDLATKRALFERLEPLRRAGSVVSTNTSGIPLRDITAGMPERLRRDIVVTHFFNPVKVMRLMELVPDTDTTSDVVAALGAFCGARLGKGVVHAKDTVNFIGNRIGCFWMLKGLHEATAARGAGLSMETIDALMSHPVGLPSTGLYGLIDLIGLDVMDFVGKNLAVNLPADDAGRAYTAFPPAEQAMLERGQLGRKSGGGFYRMLKNEDGARRKEVFDLDAGDWRPAADAEPDAAHGDAASLLFANDAAGQFAWTLMGGTLCYAAGLVPEISDDIVNIDRAMRWGFAWKQGPFELLDAIGPARVAERLQAEGTPLPKMLAVLQEAGADSFYRHDGAEFLGLDGAYRTVPGE